jgi:hypothetical protein
MELFKGKKMPSLFNNQYKNLASKGRYGDTMLAHINPQEAALLKSMGGAGTINPKTGLREFYGMNTFGDTWKTLIAPPPEPSLGQVLAPEAVANIPQKLETVTVPATGFSINTRPAYEIINPELKQYADLAPSAGMGAGQQTLGYTVPTTQTLQGQPLVAKYDAQGNFKYLTMEGNNFLTPDPSQPNIIAQPIINAKGEMTNAGVFDVTADRGGGFGDFLGGFVQDFGPMIALGLGANALLGSGLLGGGAAGATGGTLAGMGTGAAGAATTATITGTPLAALTAGGATTAGLAAGGGSAGGLAGMGTGAAGVNSTALASTLTPAALGVTGLTAALPISSVPTPPTGGGGYPSAPTGIPAAVSAAGSSITPSMLDSISKATGISVDTLKTFGPSVIQGLVSATGSILTSEQAKTAAQTQADAQIRAAQIAADAARFRPVGVTTRFGTSNFTTDAQGNVTGAGYTPSAEILGYQNRLSTLANQGLTGAEGAQAAYAPLTSAAQNLFSLGQSYLAKTPEQAAQEYITKQTALLTPSRENQLAELRNRQFQTGRTGVAIAQGGNLMNTSPELAAYYNSLAQQDLVLAANADQEARNRIQFGSGLFDTGANLQGRYYTGQTAAYSPFTTAMDTSSGLERLAQQPLDLSTSIGQKVSTANANVGQLTGQGIINAAGTMAPANAYSLGGNLLSGAASSPVLAGAVNKAFGNTQPTQQQYTFNPQTGQYVPVSQSVWI